MDKQSISTWLRLTLEILLYYITLFRWDNKKLILPPLNNRTLVLSKKACDIVEEVKSNKLRATTLILTVKERMSVVNPIINAVTTERYSLAMKDAKVIDDILNANTADATLNKPLLGIPFTVQDSMGVRDMPHTMGLMSRKHLKSPEDSSCVKLLKDAGGIIVGVTNVPEGDIWCETRNNVFGQTTNPHHAGRSVGGSGGGEAAIVSSICSSFGLCRDYCGSSLMAASYCGVFCHVPTPGIVVSNGVGPNNYKTLNPAVVSKSADDLALVIRVLSERSNTNLEMGKVGVNNIKFYYADLPINDRKTSKKHFKKIVSLINKDLEKNVDIISIKGLEELPFLRRCWEESQKDENARILGNRKGKVIGVLELIKKLLGLSRHTLGAILSLINYPNVSENDIIATNATLANIKHELTVPIGVTDDGMPHGVQVISAPYHDAVGLRVAKYLETSFGGHVAPPHT